MSIFQWFSKTKPTKTTDPTERRGPGSGDAGGAASSPSDSSSRKHERLEQRELLYAVVRESMTRIGILSANYKFKVLSLDSRGRKYMIMMDLTRLYADETGKLAEIENVIAQTAKNRHDIFVTAVYWRVDEHVVPSLAKTTPISARGAQHEPLRVDEMAAFKRALASVSNDQSLSSPGEIVRSGRRNPASMPAFADTEVDQRHTPLSGTQYGDLN
jgi:hypothetical protein